MNKQQTLAMAADQESSLAANQKPTQRDDLHVVVRVHVVLS
jgi:hypothetical protein